MIQKKRKILVFTLGCIGGAERMALTISKLLPKDKFYVKFVLLGNDMSIMDFMPKEYEVDNMSFSKASPFSIIRLYRKIKQEKPDIIFGTQAVINPQVTIAARLTGKKVVLRSSSMISAYRGIKYYMVKFFYKFADIIIAQQEQMRKQIIELCNVKPNKVVTLQNILDFENIDMKICEPSPFETEGKVNYVNVARISSEKSQDILIKAFTITKQAIPNANLYFIGAINDKHPDYYQMVINMTKELGVEDSVHFIGYDSNPYKWVKHCDCFVFPSRMEGLPNALIEASYIGVPCVATKCLDIISEIIKDGYNGYTTDVDNVEGLADGMKRAIALTNFNMVYKPNTKEDYIKLFESI